MGKGATSSGGGKANSRNQDQARAGWMAKHPNQFPDSIMRSRKIARDFIGMGAKMSDVRRERMMEWSDVAFMCGATNVDPFGRIATPEQAAAIRAQ